MNKIEEKNGGGGLRGRKKGSQPSDQAALLQVQREDLNTQKERGEGDSLLPFITAEFKPKN